MACVDLNIVVSNVVGNNITVLRNPGNSNANVTKIVLFIDGENFGTKDIFLVQLNTTPITPTTSGIDAYVLTTGTKIKIGAILSNGAACSPSTEYTVD